MGDSKLEIKVGSITFSGEGAGDWLAKQFDKLLDRAPELLAVTPPAETSGNTTDNGGGSPPGAPNGGGGKAVGTLAAFLKTKNATSSQPRKFLATALWLQDGENKNRMTTTDVSAALSKHNQGRLNNASDCLLKNAAKGLVVREGKQFYVTDEGREDLK